MNWRCHFKVRIWKGKSNERREGRRGGEGKEGKERGAERREGRGLGNGGGKCRMS